MFHSTRMTFAMATVNSFGDSSELRLLLPSSLGEERVFSCLTDSFTVSVDSSDLSSLTIKLASSYGSRVNNGGLLHVLTGQSGSE